MSRYQAFAIHLGISLLIFVALAALVVYVWYPDFFFETDGGWQGIQIIILVDLVLGPLLTLIVYRHGKPGLKMDLTLIGVFQALCLFAGVYIVYSERPLALVFVDGQFNSVTADTFRNAQIDLPNFDNFPGPTPKWIMVDMPSDPTKQSEARREMMQRQLPVALLTQYYRPFDKTHRLFVNDSTDIDHIKSRDPDGIAFADFFGSYGGGYEDYRFYPYAARYDYFYLGFSAKENELAGPLSIHIPEVEAPSGDDR